MSNVMLNYQIRVMQAALKGDPIDIRPLATGRVNEPWARCEGEFSFNWAQFDFRVGVADFSESGVIYVVHHGIHTITDHKPFTFFGIPSTKYVSEN